MRNLFLALVLANLGFAAWAAWFAVPESRGRSADDGLPALTLVSEVPEDLRSSGVVVEPAEGVAPAESSAPSETVSPIDGDAERVAAADEASADDESPADPATDDLAASVDAAVTSCTSVGPFRDLSQAATAAATLRAADLAPAQRVSEGDVWIGYWVYIPAIPTEREANEILEKVRADGIADSYVIPNSDSGNLVSLGVFSEISGVSRRRDQVRALGLEPQVVDRTRRATVYWIDVTLGAGQTLDFDSLQPPGRIIRLEQRPCEAPPG